MHLFAFPKYSKFAYLFALMMVSISCKRPETSLSELQQNIDTLLKKQQGNFSVAFKDLTTGESIFINAHELFHAASTMKTPVLVEIFNQVKDGKFSLSDSLVLRNEFHSIIDSSLFSLKPSDDSEFELYKHLGEKRSIGDLMYLMITVSSNFATNLLIEKVGAEKVTASMRQMGLKDLKVLRGVEDQKAFDNGRNNVVTSYDLMLIFEKIARKEAVSASASEAMIKVLEDQQFNEIIPAGVPKGIKIAHKTGWFKGVNHDSGIVFLPDGRVYVLVLLSKDAKDDKASITTLAKVSGMIYTYLTQRRV